MVKRVVWWLKSVLIHRSTCLATSALRVSWLGVSFVLGEQYEMKTLDEYATKIGKFWINFNSIELLLRVYLTKKNKESEVGLELDVGSSCPLSHLTNYDTFETLAAKYNDAVSDKHRINVSNVARQGQK